MLTFAMDSPRNADQELQRRKLLLVFYDADGSIAFEDRIGNIVYRADPFCAGCGHDVRRP